MFYPSQEYAPIGSLKARYRPLGLVAQGQFGKVYCAVHRASGRLVALKLLDRHRSSTSQFLRELSSLLSLRHPALTQLRAIEQTDAGRCLVLDYSSGGTLRQLLESPSRPRQELILQGMVHILEGLAHAHERGIIHCDVKPENILMQPQPQGWQACLTDFGIAQSHGSGDGIGIDPAFERGGSPAYMAPERFAGEAYRASDLYSMGIILHEVLLGDRPFHGSPNALREAHRQAAIKFPQSLDITFQKLLFRALSKSPDLRYQSAKAMAMELRKVIKLAPGLASGTEQAIPHGRSSRPPLEPAQATTKLFHPAVTEALLPWPVESATRQQTFAHQTFACPTSAPKRNVPTQGVAILPCPSLTPVAQQPIERLIDRPIEKPSTTSSLKSQATQSSEDAADQATAQPKPAGNESPFPRLCFFQGNEIHGLSLEGLMDDREDWHLDACLSLNCPSQVIQLVLTPFHGFALTESALFRWSWWQDHTSRAIAKPPQANPTQTSKAEVGSPGLHCLLQGQTNLGQIVLSPQGQWAAIVQPADQPQKASSQEAISKQTSSKLSGTLLLANLQQAQTHPLAWRTLKLQANETLMGVQILDRRHGAALLSTTGPAQRLALFSRRGQWLNTFSLPVSLTFWVRGSQPYELWGIEAEHPKVLLKLGLKPFRVQRIPLAIAPDQIYALSWGIVLINQAGELLLLNRDGQSLGQLQVPLPNDAHQLWLAPVAPHLLTVIIQRSQQWQCFPLNLRDLDLMLVL